MKGYNSNRVCTRLNRAVQNALSALRAYKKAFDTHPYTLDRWVMLW